MRVGVLSDTHMPVRAKSLPDVVLEALTEVDLVLHAGDIVSAEVLDALRGFAPVVAVAGNCDPAQIQADLGKATLVQLSEHSLSISITHGDLGRGQTPARSLRVFTDNPTNPTDLAIRRLSFDGVKLTPHGGNRADYLDETAHCVVFGHTHSPYCRYHQGILLFNPGSPTDRRWSPYCTYGILHISDNESNDRRVEGEIIRVERA